MGARGWGPPCFSPDASASFLPAKQQSILLGCPDTCHPDPLHLPSTQKDHQILSLSQNAPLPFQLGLPLCTHTHLGSSKVTKGRLSPQHLAQDGTTPLPVRELSLPLSPQGPKSAPRTELRLEQAECKPLSAPETRGPLAAPLRSPTWPGRPGRGRAPGSWHCAHIRPLGCLPGAAAPPHAPRRRGPEAVAVGQSNGHGRQGA